MYNEYFVPYPTIETDRLIIRKVKKSDAEDLYELCRRPETSRYSLWSPHGDLNATKEFIDYQLYLLKKKQCYFFCVEEKETGRVIGTCSYLGFDDSFKITEIGYSILSDLWGNGYGPETAAALTGYAFDRIGVQRVCARIIPENEASAKTLLKIGFVYEGTEQKGYYYNGRVSDVDVYAITDDIYKEV